MLSVERYDAIVVDIDDTLITGKYVAFMDLMWRIFKSTKLSNLLISIQSKFKFYRLNHKVANMLVDALWANKEVYFLTARCFNQATEKLIHNIFDPREFNYGIVSLGSYNPSQDKFEWIQGHNLKNCVLIDDNFKTRLKCYEICDVIHPEDI